MLHSASDLSLYPSADPVVQANVEVTFLYSIPVDVEEIRLDFVQFSLHFVIGFQSVASAHRLEN